MKYTIEGFSQEYAIKLKKEIEENGKTKTIKIDCTDLVILRWFVDFFPKMIKMYVDGKEYAKLTHKKMMEDLPILDISRKACIERMQKLVAFEILEYKIIRDGGTFSLYGFGKNYINLVSKDTQSGEGWSVNQPGGVRSTGQGVVGQPDMGVVGQPDNKDNSISNTSIKNKSNIYTPVVDYLNQKAGTEYKAASKATQSHINARVAEGFTLDDFKRVIDNKIADWKGTEWEKFLRPQTLFGTKFESYLNAKPKNTQPKDTSLDDIF